MLKWSDKCPEEEGYYWFAQNKDEVVVPCSIAISHIGNREEPKIHVSFFDDDNSWYYKEEIAGKWAKMIFPENPFLKNENEISYENN